MAERGYDAPEAARVAIIGGGCGAISAAFELTRPEHKARYDVTVYQLGWRLGGKGASGRGTDGRIEEHGLHVWLGFYENAFRLLRECYAELGREPDHPIATWRDAFFADPQVGLAEARDDGAWIRWTALFPSSPGLPGDTLNAHNPFTLSSYLANALQLLRTLLLDLRTTYADMPDTETRASGAWLEGALRTAVMTAVAAAIEALAVAQAAMESARLVGLNEVANALRSATDGLRVSLERIIVADDAARGRWEIIDLVVAIVVGILRDNLMFEKRGLEAIDHLDCRAWLRRHGASETAINGAFVRGLYDLALAYEDGDPSRPGLAAGQALRGALRMFFTYRGQMFWKMRAGMGDIVFAPMYEVLKRRGVRFEFFHRLERMEIGNDGSAHIAALHFDVQAELVDGDEYQPLQPVLGLPCWPSEPLYAQLRDGEKLAARTWDAESFWDTYKVRSKRLAVGEDFDFVLLGVGGGAVRYVTEDLVATNAAWANMVRHIRTVPTQAFQLWMQPDMEALGWRGGPINLPAFQKPFDTWADMSHLAPFEQFASEPGAIAYFCGVLRDEPPPDRAAGDYPATRHAEVRRNAIEFLNTHIGALWPKATDADGQFRFSMLLADAEAPTTSARFDSQFWTANINPSDRYVLALPGTLEHRISPLATGYDNLTVAGDWTACGFMEGCVEAAIMSGRLAAHAISGAPPLADIVGFDHP